MWLNQEITFRILVHKFSQMDYLLERTIDVEQDIKVEKVIKTKEGIQLSSTWSQGSKFKKNLRRILQCIPLEKEVILICP